MGTTGFSASLNASFSSIFSFSVHPILGGVLAGLGFWPKASPKSPSPSSATSSDKAKTTAPNAPRSDKSDGLEPSAASETQAGQQADSKPGSAQTLQSTQPAAQQNLQALRVIRFIEAGGPAANASQMAGRMVISGRMSDVCAELDRLAA